MHDFRGASYTRINTVHTVFCGIHAPPQIEAPHNLLDHAPEYSSPKIYMTMLFNDRFNAVSHEIIQNVYTKNSALSQLITVTGPKPQVAILFQ